jgi:hypothetical protein
MTRRGVAVDCSNSTAWPPGTFMEPDVTKCEQIPYFCDDQLKPKKIWNAITDTNGNALPKVAQENAPVDNYVVDKYWQDGINQLANPKPTDLYEKKIEGCFVDIIEKEDLSMPGH